MRVGCDIDVVILEGDYGDVDGTRATCSRCGHETESFGTSDASVRRCLALLRSQCRRSEKNFYFDAETGPQRSTAAAAYERGYRDGRAAASQDRQLTGDELRTLVGLTHPDRHPPERFEIANTATARLLELLDQERDAA